MTSYNPTTLAELTQSLSNAGQSVNCPRFDVRAYGVQVLSTVPDFVSGYLATPVRETQEAYTARYMAGQGRTRKPKEVRSYVTRSTGHVLAVILNDGTVVTDLPHEWSEFTTKRARRRALLGGVAEAARRIVQWGMEE